MDHLRCVVERITYQNTENGFSVIKCRAKGFQDLVTVVGNMPDVHVGSVLTMQGQCRMELFRTPWCRTSDVAQESERNPFHGGLLSSDGRSIHHFCQ